MRPANAPSPSIRLPASGFLLFCLAISAFSEPRPSAPEYNVKAGYVLLFTRYVIWPEDVFPLPDTPITVAVLGDDPFGTVLDATFRNISINGRKVTVIRAKSAAEAQKSHLVFISRLERDRQNEWLDSLKRKGVLSVTETENGILEGAVINFTMDRKYVRFDVDLEAMKSAGLKISSPMLVSARKIHHGPEMK